MNIEWSSTPPSEPGIYPFTQDNECFVMRIWRTPHSGLYSEVDGLAGELGSGCCPLRDWKGHWGPRIDFQPYVPPKPPEIEAWVCERDGAQKLLHKVDDGGFIADRRGDWAYVGAANVRTREQWESMGYTNWRKLEVTTEWSNDQ